MKFQRVGKEGLIKKERRYFQEIFEQITEAGLEVRHVDFWEVV